MKRLNPVYLLLFFLPALALFAAGCKTAPSAEGETPVEKKTQTTCRFGYNPQNIHHLAALVSKENGGYTPTSAIVFAPFADDRELPAALFAGKIDAAYTDPIAVISTPDKIKILSGATRQGAALFVRIGEVKTPHELSGKSVAVHAEKSFEGFLLDRFLKTTKMDGRVYLLVRPDENPAKALVQSRALDGFLTRVPLISNDIIGADQIGIMTTAKELEPDAPATVLAISATFLAANAPFAATLVAAHEKSVEWINNNPEPAANLAAKVLGVSNEDAANALSQIIFDTHIRDAGLAAEKAYLAGLSQPE